LRTAITNLARRLHRQAPHHLWLVAAASPGGRAAALATWVATDDRTRVAALVFDPQRVLESDSETLLALHAASSGPEISVHQRWNEILGREALSHRFYRALEHHVLALGEGAHGRASSDVRRELALVTTSRLLFLAFLQSRGWLDGDADFLVHHLDRVLHAGGDAHRRFLEPLFFGTLNTRVSRRASAARAFGRVPFLNGGLFARSPLERTHRSLRFRDDDLGGLFDELLTRYRFTPREQQAPLSERAIDPEMLGRAFESLMASRERRDSGSYFTPHALVVRVTDAALADAIASAGLGGDPAAFLTSPQSLPVDAAMPMQKFLSRLRLIDPACGSGAFLVHALERLAELLARAGDTRAPSAIRRAVLARSIFGVDLNPMAVWLCELRLWLSVVMDLEVADPLEVPPLPNLDRNVRVGDALAGGSWAEAPPGGNGGAFETLRGRYARATGVRKATLGALLDRSERRAALAELDARLAAAGEARRTLVRTARGRDLFGLRRGSLGEERIVRAELRDRMRALRRTRASVAHGGALPFRFASHFADIAGDGGFDVAIGNPPWVRLHRIPADRRDAFRREFSVYRNAAWESGATAAGAGQGFAAQVDLAALFAERTLGLLRPNGTLALLLPLKLWRSLAGGGLRRLLLDEHHVSLLEDWSEAPATFDAAVYPSLIVARRGAPGEPGSNDVVQLGVHRRDLAISWSCPRSSLPFDGSPGSPWLLLPTPARAAFARITRAGTPLADSGLGRPVLGVKCGCNEAFLVECVEGGVTGALVEGAGHRGVVEGELLRPILRGQQAQRWCPERSRERILWTHDVAGRPLTTLPPLAAKWLGRWRRELAARTDLRGTRAWWTLHRIEGATSHRPRVVWADVSRGPRACVLPANSPLVPLNSCYVVTCRDDVDAAALAALLNSSLAAAWLDALAEPARGGFRRYLGWTVARLPIPADWARAREVLAPIGQRGVAGEAISGDELLDAAVTAYRIRGVMARSLVEWTWR